MGGRERSGGARRRRAAGLVIALTVGALWASTPPAEAVIGGRPASSDEAPFMVSLVLAETGVHQCGGSVIAPSWVLTAAHCFVDVEPAELRAVIGRLRRSDASSGTVHEVVAVVPHPRFDELRAVHDVALVRLATPTSAPRIRLAPSWDGALERDGRPVTAYGWGGTLIPIGAIGGLLDSPDELRAADLQVVDDGACARAYAMTRPVALLLGEAIEASGPDHVCAAGLLRDSCYGDSGGPLVTDAPGGPVQVGITSTGFLCAAPTHAGIYTEVNSSAVRGFIRRTAGV